MIDEKILLESRILIVDDNPSNVLLLERMLEWIGYVQIKSTTSSVLALELFETYLPDVVLLDLHMPALNGFDILQHIRERDDPMKGLLPVLVFTADTTPQAKEKALTFGASDFLTKPGDAIEIKLRLQTFLEMRYLHQQVAEHSAQLQVKVEDRTRALWESQKEIVERLTRVAAFHDDPSGAHCQRVGRLSGELARELGLDRTQRELIRLAAPLHDLGKLGLSEALLLSRGPQTPDQRLDSERHTVIGDNLLSGGRSPLLVMAALIAKHHHENWDGSGYPSGLAGDEIPRPARIVAVADAFDSMVFPSGYVRRLEPTVAVGEIASGNGTRFDPAVVLAFLKLVGDGRHLQQTEAVAA